MSSEAMSLEEYKKKVEVCLMKNCNLSEEVAKSRMQLYESNLQGFMDENYPPETAAVGMAMMLL